MSDLLSLLSLGSAGIAAQNTGVSVATNNVANVNTEGYSRQRVDLEALRAAPLVGGVRSGSPDRISDYLLSGRIRTTAGSLAMARAFADALMDVEARMTGSGPTIHDGLGTLFARIQHASAAPTDPISRSAVVTAARDLVEGIRRQASQLAEARAEANARIRDSASQASALAQQLADANVQVARTNDPVLRDQRDLIAQRLSELVGGAARIDGDGQMRFVLDGGAVLVDGGRAASLEVAPAASGDLAVLVVDGAPRRDVTASLSGGQIGADRTARDGAIAQAAAALDQLAFDLATAMNATHEANAGLDGMSGRSMFVAPAQVAGAAATLALDPALVADPSRLALASPGSGPGDNRGALALLALADAPVAAGGRSLGGAALDLVGALGTEASRARAAVAQQTLVLDHLSGLRDSLSGVDLQEELSNLARFEHASSAMTRFVSTIDSLLGDLIDRL